MKDLRLEEASRKTLHYPYTTLPAPDASMSVFGLPHNHGSVRNNGSVKNNAPLVDLRPASHPWKRQTQFAR